MRSILLLVLFPGVALGPLSGPPRDVRRGVAGPGPVPAARSVATQGSQPVSAAIRSADPLAALSATVGAQSGESPSGNAENGKKLFVERGCWQCHGFAAQGGGIAGPRLAGRVPAWPAFSRAVRRPLEEMVPYTEKMLPNTELADIYAWLKAIPPPPAVNNLPQLGR
jgi:mono/diheme cytochrome c family protein